MLVFIRIFSRILFFCFNINLLRVGFINCLFLNTLVVMSTPIVMSQNLILSITFVAINFFCYVTN